MAEGVAPSGLFAASVAPSSFAAAVIPAQIPAPRSATGRTNSAPSPLPCTTSPAPSRQSPGLAQAESNPNAAVAMIAAHMSLSYASKIQSDQSRPQTGQDKASRIAYVRPSGRPTRDLLGVAIPRRGNCELNKRAVGACRARRPPTASGRLTEGLALRLFRCRHC